MATPPASNGSRSGPAASKSSVAQRLEVRFPVNTHWELVLQPEETVQGRIYCTDEGSQTIVLLTALPHTVLSSEIRIINVSSIVKATPQKKKDGETSMQLSKLPLIQKKVLEERERKALRMAEDSLRHINEKVRPGLLFFY